MKKRIDFNLLGSDNSFHTLNDFKGLKVILYFYPKDNTPGCSIQAEEFSAYKEILRTYNYIVVGISRDNLISHEKFCTKHSINYLLLSDPDLNITKLYGATKKYLGIKVTNRSTFILNEEGYIEKQFIGVSAKTHQKELINLIKNRQL